MQESFEKLIKLVEKLRKECPWDREQTIENYKEHIKNETDEILQAIENNDYENLKEEIGDLLFNLLMLAEIAKDKNLFTLKESIDHVYEKLIKRHPHVFSNIKLKTPEEVRKQWHKIKENEKQNE